MITCKFATSGALADPCSPLSIKTIVRTGTYYVQATAHWVRGTCRGTTIDIIFRRGNFSRKQAHSSTTSFKHLAISTRILNSEWSFLLTPSECPTLTKRYLKSDLSRSCYLLLHCMLCISCIIFFTRANSLIIYTTFVFHLPLRAKRSRVRQILSSSFSYSYVKSLSSVLH